MPDTALLRVKNLKKYFPIRGGLFSREVARVHAVDDVTFDLMKGETLGLVGESGCGKSTTGRCILRLIEPTAGEVWFDDKNVTTLDKRSLRHLRRDMQIIFQDPSVSTPTTCAATRTSSRAASASASASPAPSR